MGKNKIIREDGKLTVQFEFDKTLSMLEMEEQIESFLSSLTEDFLEPEKNSIRLQLLNALKDTYKKC